METSRKDVDLHYKRLGFGREERKKRLWIAGCRFSKVCLISALFVGYAFKTMIYDQAGYDIVCEWGAEGVSIIGTNVRCRYCD
jgi:hypothetical protein